VSSSQILHFPLSVFYSLSLHDALPISKPRDRPRRAASERFSAIVRFGDVPLNGFWNTRPINLARRNSGHAVTSWPAIRRLPLSTDRKSTRLNSSHSQISYAVFCLKKKK